MATHLATLLLNGFDDPRFGPTQWDKVLAAGDTRVVFLTRLWQQVWWEVFGRGQLLLVAVEREGQVVALAPLFCDGGMIFFVGSGGSDYLDFIGDISEAEILDALLNVARNAVTDFVGFRFYHVPDGSRTGPQLQRAASRLRLTISDEGDLSAPALDLATRPEAGREAASKSSLLRHQKFFERQGELTVRHHRQGKAIRPELDAFFAQHVARWAATPSPSLFHDPAQRRFYERLTEGAAEAGWLRFTRVNWNGQPIAFHFGFCYGGSYLWYKPSFDIAWARRSPGEVLLRQLFCAAMAEGAHTFDFGLGDEPFKRRFATQINRVRTWGLYPRP
jgi:CelD/BcsL family acetyltransferase involved in cellulose biosynthesis